MGAWGAGLYANDVTGDVRDAYLGFLQDQAGNRAAYEKTLERFAEYIGDEDEPLLWYALADTMWKTGRLTPEVKAKALGWIGRSGGLAVWLEGASRGAGWRKTLAALKAELESPQPSEKRIRKPVEFVRNPWGVGDVYAYQLHTDIAARHGLCDWYIPFQKVGDIEWYSGWTQSVVRVYDQAFDQLPTLADLAGVRILPLVFAPGTGDGPKTIEEFVPEFGDRYLEAGMVAMKKSHYPRQHLTFVGNQALPVKDYSEARPYDFFWDSGWMESWLIPFYLSWRGVDY